MSKSDVNNDVPRVLVADDDELARSLITASLTESGFSCEEVSDGVQAVAAFAERQHDLVVLDVEMPVLDGFDACWTIRSMDSGRHVPIVIVTGNDDTESVERAFECSATDFISKPVNWTLLGYRMRYVLRASEMRSALVEREADNRALLEALPDQLVMLSASGKIQKVLGNGPAEPSRLQEHLESLLPDDVVPAYERAMDICLSEGGVESFEFSEQRDRETSFYEARLLPQPDAGVLVILRDVTQRKQTEREIRRLAYTDVLTSLPNRHALEGELSSVLTGGYGDPEVEQNLAIYFVGLDRFKRINDSLGHSAGDDALRQVGHRLRELCSELQEDDDRAFVARFGGDEFVLVHALTRPEDAHAMTDRLRSVFARPVTCDRHEVLLVPSIGVVVAPEHGRDCETLLQRAAHSLTLAKTSGGASTQFFTRIETTDREDPLKLEIDLRAALRGNDLSVVYQPKVDLVTGAITGAEALLRWYHPTRGYVSPASFIPTAEQTGLIIDIGHWVIDTVCAQLSVWRDRGFPHTPVSVNLSGREFCFDRPAEHLAAALARNDLSPDLVEVEITETVLMEDQEAAERTLEKLHGMGIRLSIDDFGIGYSSMSYLKRFQVDAIKIDREFVRDLERDAADRALCGAIVSLAKALELDVVAEGIETDFQRHFLVDMGCLIGQGYLLSKPLPVVEFEDLLLSSKGPLVAGDTSVREKQPHV